MWSYLPNLHVLFFYLTVILISYIELPQRQLMRWSYGGLWMIVYSFKLLTFSYRTLSYLISYSGGKTKNSSFSLCHP